MRYDGTVAAQYRAREEKRAAYHREYQKRNREKLTDYAKEWARGKRWLEGASQTCKHKRNCEQCPERDCRVAYRGGERE